MSAQTCDVHKTKFLMDSVQNVNVCWFQKKKTSDDEFSGVSNMEDMSVPAPAVRAGGRARAAVKYTFDDDDSDFDWGTAVL